MSNIKDEIEALGPRGRRRFFKLVGAAMAAPLIPSALRFACNEVVGGTAYAQAAELARGTCFIEINLRDQWDQMHVMVPPGLAGNVNLRRGETGRRCTLYAQGAALHRQPNGVVLTDDSLELAPHLDTVAQCDFFQPSLGNIHGHEAANEVRSPGRSYESGGGKVAMYEREPSGFSEGGGNERHHSRVPTPASIHNYQQKRLDPSLRNGFAFKGISRANHTVYHYAANLPGGELDRIRNRNELFSAFPSVTQDVNVVSAREAQLFGRVLRRVDARNLMRRRYQTEAVTSHTQVLSESEGLLYQSQPRVVSIPLTDQERDFWSPNIPNQMCTRGDRESFECDDGSVKGQIWEQVAWASKVLLSGVTRTVALEFDYMDLHGFRPQVAVSTQGKQCARALARLITDLKANGLYERTLIAVYTLDGSRSPAADSYGDSNDAKNTVILAGGMVRGGYYGDIVATGNNGDGHNYGYMIPDPETGMPGPMRTGDDGRLSSARIWRTVTKALGIPDELCNTFSDVANQRPYSWLLRV